MIEIQCKRPDDADFITVGFDSSEPYLDARAPVVRGLSRRSRGQPEVRRNGACLRLVGARCRDANGPIGIWSDIVSATAQP